MSHGIHEFFLERTRSRRRVAGLSVLVGAVLMLGLGVLMLPPFHRALQESPLRFGFEGPTRYVKLLQIEAQPGRDAPLTVVGRVEPRGGRHEGGGGVPVPVTTGGRQRSRPEARTPGLDGTRGNLVARALASQGRVPIFQSEQLIIDRLVRPIYPDEARDRGIEGRVAVLAHIDTTGAVVEAEVMKPSGELLLDRAAEEAVLLCHFRPYRVRGKTQEVYAIFRFRFRLTEP